MRVSDFAIVTPIDTKELIREEVRYLTKAIVSTSPLRGQGPKGTIDALRNFLNNRNWIEDFRGVAPQKFQGQLDILTKEMSDVIEKLEGGFENWGGPRKVLNILFTQLVDRDRIAQHYSIRLLRPHLEAPLDNFMIQFLRRQRKLGLYSKEDKAALREWRTIKGSGPDLNSRIQAAAMKVANHINCHRCDLDFLAWRDAEPTNK